MTELLDFAFQKGGATGVLCLVFAAVAYRLYKDNLAHVKARHLDDLKYRDEIRASKDEVIRIKEACENKIQALYKELLQTTQSLMKDQLAQQEANTVQIRELAKSKNTDSKLVRDVLARIDELERRPWRNTPRPPPSDFDAADDGRRD